MTTYLEYSSTNLTTTKKAWEEFISTGSITEAAPRPIIVDGWQQSREKGIDPKIDRARSVLENDELELKLNSEDLGKVGRPILERLSSTTHKTRHVIVLANAEGQIIYSVGHQEIQSKLDSINFMPGGAWSIDEVGPNGVGTPIAINSPELIYGSEHYCEAWQPWACYGSPIHDNNGNVIGCIDITGPTEDLSMQTMTLAMSLAHSVESGLNLICLQKRELLRSIYKKRKSAIKNEQCFLVDEMGFVIDFDEPLSQLFAVESSSLWMFSLERHARVLWEKIKLCISVPYSTELQYQQDNNQDPISLIVEPIYQSENCLGALIILNSAYEAVTPPNVNLVGQESVFDINLRTKSDQLIRDALEKTNGNISKAARLLGINRTTIYRRLKLLKK